MDYEVIVVGGGIQGVGIAQAASAAGYKVAIFEKRHWGSETSSKSSKLIHGGLRYLETAQCRLVFQALAERETLLRIAPELVKPIPFYIPVYEYSKRSSLHIYSGLTLYRLLAHKSKYNQFRSIPRTQWSSLDGIDQHQLKQVFSYWDAQTNDQKLTQSVLASCVELGLDTYCPANITEINKHNHAYQVSSHINESKKSYSSKLLINACGPWANNLLTKLTPQTTSLPIDLVRGSHILIGQPASPHVFYIESHLDHRAILIMPWQGKTLIGTTERIHPSIDTPIVPEPQEIEYLLASYAKKFPENNLQIIDSWAGLRVLPKSSKTAFNRSRETLFHSDIHAHPNLLTVYGGKLTTYRHTGEQVVQWISQRLGNRAPIANTKDLSLRTAN